MRIPTAVAAALLAAGPALGGAGEWAAHPHSQVRLIAAEAAVDGRDRLRIGVEIRLEPGWETYWRTPGDAGVPPAFDWGGSSNVGLVRIEWPRPERLVQSGMVTYGYRDEVVFPAVVTVPDGGRAVRLRLALDYAVCREVCIPVAAEAALDIPAAGGRADPEPGARIERFAATVPRAPAPGGITVERLTLYPGQFLEILARTGAERFESPWVIVEAPGGVSFGGAGARLLARGQRALFRAALPSPDAVRALAGAAVTVTLIDGDRAVERTLPADPADN